MDTFNKYYDTPVFEEHGMFFDNKNKHILDIDCKFPEDKPLTDVLLAKLNNQPTDIKISKRVMYKPTKIYTVEGDLLLSIRGWGRFKYLPDGEKIQDAIGQEIADMLNSAAL